MLLLPGSPEVIEGLVAAAAAAPEELSLIANVMVAPPMPFIPASAHGQLVVMALLAYAGDAEAGERALAPIRALAEPLADMVQPMPYAGLFQGGDDMEVVEESARSLFCDTVDATAAKAVIEHLQASTAPMAVAQLRVLGGAMARVPVEATAFAHRQRPMMAGVGCVYEQAADRRPTTPGRRVRRRPAPGRPRRLRQLPRRRGAGAGPRGLSGAHLGPAGRGQAPLGPGQPVPPQPEHPPGPGLTGRPRPRGVSNACES